MTSKVRTWPDHAQYGRLTVHWQDDAVISVYWGDEFIGPWNLGNWREGLRQKWSTLSGRSHGYSGLNERERQGLDLIYRIAYHVNKGTAVARYESVPEFWNLTDAGAILAGCAVEIRGGRR